jgi:hypothetical protein
VALSLAVKWTWHEADHSPPSGAKVKNVWSYTSILPYMYMAWYLIKHRENFAFTFILDVYRILWLVFPGISRNKFSI